MASKNTVPADVWDRQADLYELGEKHGNEIAMELGVSPQTVSREMKKRGAVKGSRVAETVCELEAFLDEKAERAALMEKARAAQAQHKRAAAEQVIDSMINAVIAADMAGDMCLASERIERTAQAFGMRLHGKRR